MPSALFWAGVGGGTAQYRCRIPGAALTRTGWDVHHVNEGELPAVADVVVLQRVLHPGVPELIRGLRAAGSLVVYDIDDWYDGIPAYNPANGEIGPAETELLHESIGAVDLITTSTPELAEAYAWFGPTAVLPNYLDAEMWSDIDRYRVPHDEVHVGWLGSAKWRSADVELLRPWLKAWLSEHAKVRFVLAGSDASLLEYLGIGGLVCPPAKDHIRPYEHLPAMLAWFDIGLVPLVYNRFNEAKSWCKGLEYSAAGAAVVASPSREYRRFITPGLNGFLVRKNDWCGALERTLSDLEELRTGARKVADTMFIDDHIDEWVSAWEGAR